MSYLSNTPFLVDSGSFRISMDTIEGQDVKVIECVSAGILYVPTSLFKANPTEAAYGTWDWWQSKGAATVPTILFIADTVGGPGVAGQDGYRLRMLANEIVELQRITNGAGASLFYTTTGAVTPNTFTRFTTTRNYAGVFTVYKDGTILGNIDFGTNPVTDNNHTISTYFTLDFDAGDKIAYSDLQGDHCIQKMLGVAAP